MFEEGLIKQRFYTMSEVHLHNAPDDIWVSFLGKVFDLTPLHHLYKGNNFTNVTFDYVYLMPCLT